MGELDSQTIHKFRKIHELRNACQSGLCAVLRFAAHLQREASGNVSAGVHFVMVGSLACPHRPCIEFLSVAMQL